MFWSAAPGFQDLMLSCCAFRAYYRGLNNYQHYFGGSLLLLYHKGPLYRGVGHLALPGDSIFFEGFGGCKYFEDERLSGTLETFFLMAR